MRMALRSLLVASVLAACGPRQVDVYAALYLDIRAAPGVASVIGLHLRLRNMIGDPNYAWPSGPPAGDASTGDFSTGGRDLTTSPFVLEVDRAHGSPGRTLSALVLATDTSGKVRAAWSGIIDTRTTGLVEVKLAKPDPTCDADGDGVKDCSKPGCCVAGEQTDCNDDPKTHGADMSPYAFCAGGFSTCLDSDGDGWPDCLEVASGCPPGAAVDPHVYPGAPELCDGKDDDCDGQVDGKAANATCGQGNYCDDQSSSDPQCRYCELDKSDHCGTLDSPPGCAVCKPPTGACVNGICGCKADADCTDGHYCALDGQCDACSSIDASHCGTWSSPAGCEQCPNSTPNCVEGTCKQ